MCGDIEFVVVKVDIGIQEGDSFLAEFMSKLIVGCILFILSMNFWNSLIGWCQIRNMSSMNRR